MRDGPQRRDPRLVVRTLQVDDAPSPHTRGFREALDGPAPRVPQARDLDTERAVVGIGDIGHISTVSRCKTLHSATRCPIFSEAPREKAEVCADPGSETSE